MNNRQGNQRVKKPIVEEPKSESDEFDIWSFDPGDITETLEVDPNGTQRATRRSHQGNSSTVLAQTQRMYDDRDSARKMQQQIQAEERAHQAAMQRMRQDYKITRDKMRAEMSATRRAMEEERERYRQEAELRRQEEKHRREAERLRAKEEAERRKLESEMRRQREKAERAARDAADRRRHEREMFVLNNGADMADRLTNSRIRQAEAIMKQAQDRVRFQDERAREYVGKINVERMQRGERFDKNVQVLFAQFNLDPPDVETMRRPSVSQQVRLHECKSKLYVCSRLVTGVRRIHYAENDGYIEFMNGERMTLPGTTDGFITTVLDVMPCVHVIHVYRYTPEFLGSHGYDIGENGPFDCCRKALRCNVQ